MSEEVRLREELEAANRKLSEAHKMASLGRLSAGIVHEINTPIGSIFSNNEVIRRSVEKLRAVLERSLERNEPPPQAALTMLDTVAALNQVDRLACERISGIIRSLKTLARTGNERMQVDLNELIGHTLKLAATVFRQRIAFSLEAGEIPKVECYPGLLGQVFLNLVVNGAQAIDGEGRVTVRTAAEGTRVRITISDTGRGIRPEDQNKVFLAGFTTKPLGEGTGIGLTLSREIVVEEHHGTITFHSEPGRGTTFEIDLPIEQRSYSDGD